MLSDGMMVIEVGGCSNGPELELGSTETDGPGKAELGGGREVEGEGEGSTATRDSVAVDVTIATVVKDGVAVISIIDVVS